MSARTTDKWVVQVVLLLVGQCLAGAALGLRGRISSNTYNISFDIFGRRPCLILGNLPQLGRPQVLQPL
jgi:hypothetical protein